MNYPHVYTPGKGPVQAPQPQAERKELTMEEKISKIFFRTATIEKDLAQLLHLNGLSSTNKFLNS